MNGVLSMTNRTISMQLDINERVHTLALEARVTLLDALRDHLGQGPVEADSGKDRRREGKEAEQERGEASAGRSGHVSLVLHSNSIRDLRKLTPLVSVRVS